CVRDGYGSGLDSW
nr:immunoglobulin heavy chain junction region [Macaca mulatta]MOW75454.1 immunoglobulin heavy chain junction region [Macaca mulatta]MOW75470.1 immunoglobulin heavy chain junction region [Macaca mulatta]MOW76400.1 immunoglobulin heavy chain junction region [Macaca mulatta]MOW76729.1 immunoglobulin heavy chain junction region [Macaca mulatta]